jgi:MurNAc alpha-1-phosphate uridylyltransferase
MTTITTAFVLAAGLGTRMRPLTDRMPKPLVPLAGRALIDHVLDRLAATGITRAVVNVHHMADAIERHLAGRRMPQIVISDEREALLDTGGGALKALAALGSEPFVVHNSDSVWIERRVSNLTRLMAAFDERRMDSLLLLAERTTSLGYDGRGDFVLDPEGRLARRPKDAETDFVFTGVSILHPRLLDGAPAGAFSLNVVWDRAIAAGRLYGLLLDGEWMHVGTPEAVGAAEQRLAAEADHG